MYNKRSVKYSRSWLIFDGEVSIPFTMVSTEQAPLVIPSVISSVNEYSGCISSSSTL